MMSFWCQDDGMPSLYHKNIWESKYSKYFQFKRYLIFNTIKPTVLRNWNVELNHRHNSQKKLNRMANSSEILPKYVTFIQTKSHKKISAIELIIFEKIWKKNRRFIVTPPPLGNRVKRNQRKDKRSKTDPLGMTCIRPVFH